MAKNCGTLLFLLPVGNSIHIMLMGSTDSDLTLLYLISLILLQQIYKHLLVVVQEQMAVCKYIHFQTQHLIKNYLIF